MYVLIKYRALTIDNQHMPLFMYTMPLPVIEETENTITVQFNENDYYKYTFDKSKIQLDPNHAY